VRAAGPPTNSNAIPSAMKYVTPRRRWAQLDRFMRLVGMRSLCLDIFIILSTFGWVL